MNVFNQINNLTDDQLRVIPDRVRGDVARACAEYAKQLHQDAKDLRAADASLVKLAIEFDDRAEALGSFAERLSEVL